MEIIFILIILIFSIILHEVSHGFAANYLGDPTARLAGRLTLNPIPHIDPLGSIILPAFMAITQSPIMFGWAKPVPYNPYNLGGGKYAEALVALAGPAMNIFLALFFAGVIRFFGAGLPSEVVSIAFMAAFLNIFLAFFNMLPIPPLDGSKVLDSVLPQSLKLEYAKVRAVLEQNIFLGFGIVIVFIMLFGSQFASMIYGLTKIIAGV